MNTPWDLLALEPTADVLTIKRAYAKQLKNHRPDDAPQAYQALREAYEWALQEADWIRQSIDSDSEESEPIQVCDTLTLDPAFEARDLAQPNVYNPTSETETVETDRALDLLSRWTDRLLQQNVSEESWQIMRRELDALPLDEQAVATELFADFVLAHSTISGSVLEKLAQYFQWGQDYRDAARMGAYKLTRLRELVDAHRPARNRRTYLVEQAAELLRLDWVLEHQGKLFGWLYVTLAHPIRGVIAETYATQRKVLNITSNRWRAIKAALFIGAASRLLIVLALVIPLAHSLMGSDRDIAEWMVLASYFGSIYWLVSWLIAKRLPDPQYIENLRWLNTGYTQWIVALAPPLAVALAARDKVALPLLQSFMPEGGLIGIAVAMCSLALLVWPAKPEEHVISLPMLGAFTFGLTSLTGTDAVDWVVAMGAAATWIGVGNLLYYRYPEHVAYFYNNPWAVLRPRKWWGWLLLIVAFKFVLALLALLFMLALPLTLRVIARYMSANTALLVIGLGIALGHFADRGNEASASLVIMVLCAALFTWLQLFAGKISSRVFAKAPTSFALNGD